MKGILVFVCIFISLSSGAESFSELLSKIEEHNLVKARLNRVNAMLENARQSGSWGDPKLMVAAMNFPRETLNRDQSMMTGIQFGLSQKLNLSGKYGKMEESKKEVSKSFQAETEQLKREFAKALWSLSIEKERLQSEEKVLKENLAWVERNLKVTKRLYSTGKVPQQAVLDIQIRKSELSAQVDRRVYSLKALGHQLTALFGSESMLDVSLSSVPWKRLDVWDKGNEDQDFQEEVLKHRLKAKDLKVTAQNRNFAPDITVGVNYTKRNNIDGIGDFVGAQITIPLPTSSTRYAAKSEAVFEKLEAERAYRNYKNAKPNILKNLEFEIKDTQNQLRILNKETLKYAKSSRDVTAKSYSRGGSDYLELLRAEIQYQNQLLKQIDLVSKLKEKKVNYLFIKGDDLKSGSQK
jgi:cobalt-zinc-cadmium efflux system outer membrane protein